MADRTWTDSQTCAMDTRGKLILVSAAAGSGKTSVLTERIIRRLLDREDPIDLSELLIVTFTRAAAAELKSRIANALGEALAADPTDAHLSRQLLALGSARISTIDAFYQQAVRSNFDRLGLPASFRMADQNELFTISREIMEDLIGEYYRKYEAPFESSEAENTFLRLRNNRFADCMDHIYSGNSGADLCGLLLDFYETFESYPQGIDLLQDAAKALRRDAEADFLQSRAGKVLAERLRWETVAFLRVLDDTKSHHNADPESVRRQSGILASDMDHASALLQALDAGKWESVREIGLSFPIPRFAAADGKPEWSGRYQDARKRFFASLKKDQSELFADSSVMLREKMLYSAELAEMLHELYATFRERYLAEKINRGILGFNDVRNALHSLLSGEDGDAVIRTLGGKYREIYIDEYQDVDEIQDRIFALLGGDHRFMVGDIKQSIYGFRGSDPSIFAGYRRSMPLSTDPEAKDSKSVCIFMSENFRCDQSVIDFANTVCAFLFSACPDSVSYLPQDDLQHRKKDPDDAAWKPTPAQVCIFERPSKKDQTDEANNDDNAKEPTVAREARWVAAEIARLLRDGRLNDGSRILPEQIAVLSRRGDSHMTPYIEALETLGIPVSSAAADRLSRSPLLITMLNLLRAVDNPYRDIPLSEFLTSEFGGFSLEELSEIRAASPSRTSLYDAICAAAKNDLLPFAEKISAFAEWLEHYRRVSSVQPADRFLRILYLDDRFRSLSDSPELLALYEQARVYGRSSWCGLYGYLDYITRLCENDQLAAGGFRQAESAVNVMTMHASKGLEFPVVFVVGCGSAFSNGDARLPMIYQKQIGFCSTLFRKELSAPCDTPLKKAGNLAVANDNAEGEIRLLYVALTRARERLYVTATPTRLKESLLSDVSLIRRGDRNGILRGKSFLDWILAALTAREKADGCCPAAVHWILPQPVAELSDSAEPPLLQSSRVVPADSNALADHYRAVAQRAASFVYPLDALRGIPTKAAASKLRPDLLDILKAEDAAAAVEEQIHQMQDHLPSFEGLLSTHRQPNAAEIGTATHAFLEFCDLPRLTPDGIDAELERLVSQKFLTAETARIVNRRHLRMFAESPLIAKVRSAKQVLREQKFGLFLPLSSLTADSALAEQLRGQELFVQGSIDLVLVTPDGKIELYDYKTDRVTPEERDDRGLLRSNLQARHGNQLACYARAIENLFGKRPDKTYLFLLALGEAVEI